MCNCSGKCSKCEQGQIDSNDVFYTGSYLPNLGIQTNTNFTQVLSTLNTLFGALNLGINSGAYTAIGDGLTLSYTFPHNLGGIPSGVSVDVNSEETPNNYTISYNLINITIIYSIAPSLGDNLSWTWIAVKN